MTLHRVFWSDNLEKSDQKSILSWRCHKFKRKRRYNKWNFAFFRLECERWRQLLHRCFETLFAYSNTTLLELQTLLFLFFPKSALLNWRCGLSTDAAYTRTFTVFSRLNHLRKVWQRCSHSFFFLDQNVASCSGFSLALGYDGSMCLLKKLISTWARYQLQF